MRVSTWVLLTILILATTAASSVLWNAQHGSSYVLAKGFEYTNSQVNSDQQRLKSPNDSANNSLSMNDSLKATGDPVMPFSSFGNLVM